MQINLATAQKRALTLLAIGQNITEEALATRIISDYLCETMTDDDLTQAQAAERQLIFSALGRAVPVQEVQVEIP